MILCLMSYVYIGDININKSLTSPVRQKWAHLKFKEQAHSSKTQKQAPTSTHSRFEFSAETSERA